MKIENTAILDVKDVSANQMPLREYVRQVMENYFSRLDATMLPTQLYDLVMEEVEPSLLSVTLKYTRNNQCKASKVLGISRSTLRKKLKIYDMEGK